MTLSKSRLAVAACSFALVLAPALMKAQGPEIQQRVAALKQNIAHNKQAIRQYQWIQTTTISLKGEQKSQNQKQCYYGADGTLTKVLITTTPPPEQKGGLRGRIIARKKEELTDYMKSAVALIKSYVPPDPARIQAVKNAGNMSLNMPGGGNGVRLNFPGYAKPGDMLTVEIDPASNQLMGMSVATYLDDPKDAVTLNVQYSTLNDGTGYPATEVLNATAKEITVNVTNTGYRKMQP